MLTREEFAQKACCSLLSRFCKRARWLALMECWRLVLLQTKRTSDDNLTINWQTKQTGRALLFVLYITLLRIVKHLDIGPILTTAQLAFAVVVVDYGARRIAR